MFPIVTFPSSCSSAITLFPGPSNDVFHLRARSLAYARVVTVRCKHLLASLIPSRATSYRTPLRKTRRGWSAAAPPK
jgi:hypothetical protein